MNSRLSRQQQSDGDARRSDFIAVCVLLVSFCYELPIANIFPYSRLNPCPFDLACLFALGLRLSTPRRIFRERRTHWILPPLWAYVAACTWASLITVLYLVPISYGLSSLYFLLRHFQVLLAVWLVATSRLSLQQVQTAIGVFLLASLIPLIAGLLIHTAVLHVPHTTASGDVVLVSGDRIRSVFNSYVQYSMHSLLVLSLCYWLLILSPCSRGWLRVMAVLCAPFAFLGLWLSESRAGPLGLAVIVVLASIRSLARPASWTTKSLAMALLVLVVSYFTIADLLPAEKTARFRSATGWSLHEDDPAFSSGSNAIENRLAVGPVGIAGHYHYHGPAFLLYGTGFYLSDFEGTIRRGYGIHDIHVFPLEQAGLPGFFAGLWLLWRLLKMSLEQSRDAHSPSAKGAGEVMLCWYVMITIIGLGGQVFWYFGSFGNWWALQLVVTVLLLPSSQPRKNPVFAGAFPASHQSLRRSTAIARS